MEKGKKLKNEIKYLIFNDYLTINKQIKEGLEQGEIKNTLKDYLKIIIFLYDQKIENLNFTSNDEIILARFMHRTKNLYSCLDFNTFADCFAEFKSLLALLKSNRTIKTY